MKGSEEGQTPLFKMLLSFEQLSLQNGRKKVTQFVELGSRTDKDNQEATDIAQQKHPVPLKSQSRIDGPLDAC